MVIIEFCLTVPLRMHLSKRHLIVSQLIQDFLRQLTATERLNMDKVAVAAAVALLKSRHEPLDRIVVIVATRHCLIVLRHLPLRGRTLLHGRGRRHVRTCVTHPVLLALVSALDVGREVADGKIIGEDEAAWLFRRFESHLGSDILDSFLL